MLARYRVEVGKAISSAGDESAKTVQAELHAHGHHNQSEDPSALTQHRSNLAPGNNFRAAPTGQQSPLPQGVILTFTEDARRGYRQSF